MAELPSSQTVHVNRDEVIALMKDHIFGQDPVIEDVVDSIWGNFLAENRAQPVGVFLLAGPPGSAKSRFGQALEQRCTGRRGLKHSILPAIPAHTAAVDCSERHKIIRAVRACFQSI